MSVFQSLTRATRLLLGPKGKLLRDLAMLLSSQAAAKVIGFAVFVYLARVLDTEGFGALGYALALAGFGALVVDFGLGTAGVRAIVRQPDQMARVARLVPLMRLGAACLTVPAIAGFIFLTVDGPDAQRLALLYAGSLLLLALNQEWLLQSREQMGLVALGQMLRIAVFALLCLTFVGGPEQLVLVGVAELVSVVAWIALLGIAAAARSREGKPRSSRTETRALLRTAAPLGLNGMVWGVCQHLPQVLVALIVGLEQAAWFAAAQRLTVSLQSFSYAYHFNLYPALVRHLGHSREALRALASSSVRVVAWATVGAAILVSVHAGPLMTALFGADFATAGAVLGVSIWAVPIQALSGGARWSLIAVGQSDGVLRAGIAGLVTVVVAGPLLTRGFGALGTAATVALASLAIWVAAHHLLRREGIALPFVSALWRPVLAGGLAAGAVAALNLPGIAGLPLDAIALASIVYIGIGAVLDPKAVRDLRSLALSKADLAPPPSPALASS